MRNGVVPDFVCIKQRHSVQRPYENITGYTDEDEAAVFQWESVIGEPLSEGKKHEDELTHRAITCALHGSKDRAVTGFIADEGRLEVYVASRMPHVEKVTLLTITGAFENAARATVSAAVSRAFPAQA